MDFVRVGGEMDERPLLEGEGRRTRIAAILILLDRVSPTLPGRRVFQLASRNWQAVDGENQIDRLVFPGMARHLPRDREPVLRAKPQYFVVQSVRRFEISEPEGAAEELGSRAAAHAACL